jgi:uncharacterized cupredoxin-like copper-binding protein
MKTHLSGALLVLLLTFGALLASACGDDNSASDTASNAVDTVQDAASDAASSVASVAGAVVGTVTGGDEAEGSTTAGGSGASINAVEKDFSITLDPSSTASGKVTFNIDNQGATKHELVVIKTDLAPDQLPIKSDEPEVDEDKLDGIGEKEDIDPGSSATLSLNLEPGKYVVICNLPGHYKLGMHTALTVS